jgi:hypothetical protein
MDGGVVELRERLRNFLLLHYSAVVMVQADN